MNVKVTQGLDWLNRNRWFALFVLAPTLLAAIYYGLIASDVYVAESRFVIKSPSQKMGQGSVLSSLIQVSGMSSGQEQADEVIDYLESRNALAELGSRIDLRKVYGGEGGDFLARYPQPFRSDRNENLFRYYKTVVNVRRDSTTNSVVLTVNAFRPEDARDINRRLLDQSEALVNRLSSRAQLKAIEEAEKRVASAEDRVRTARLQLGQFRNEAALLDPNKQASGVLDVANHLVSEQAALQAQLDLTLREAPQNPAIPVLRNRIASIAAEVARQNGRATGSSSALASKLGSYEKLALEQEFASQMLTAANTSLETARSEATKQQFYLERVVEPSLPDLPLLPKRLLKVLTVAAGSLCLYFIGWMLVVGILEHAPEE